MEGGNEGISCKRTSMELMFSPPLMMTSLLRSCICTEG